MAEYIDRAAVLEILDDTAKNWKQDCGLSKAEYLRIRIKNLSTADVVEVVRCRDCRHFQIRGGCGEPWCDGRRVSPDYYCADGERRVGDGA